MRTVFLLFFFVIAMTGLFSQNEAGFFKVPLQTPSDVPNWVQAMYAADPNVFEVDFLFDRYYRDRPFEKNVHTQNYKHWRRQVANFLNEEGFIRRPSYAEEEARARYLQDRRAALAHERGAVWQSLGPVETYEDGSATPISWHTNVYCVEQSAIDPDLLYAGTEGGGVFKSTDHGLNWTLVTANEPFGPGIQDIKISPFDVQTVYVTANRRIYKTENGGQNWSEVFFIDETGYQLRFDPGEAETVWCAARNGLYRTDNGGESWTLVQTGICWDVQFHPTNPSILYLLRSNSTLKRTEFFKSTDGGQNWDLKDIGWYVPADPANAQEFGAKIAVTAAAPERVYAGLIGDSKPDDNGWIGVYRSDDAGETWSNPSGQDGGPYPNNYNPAAYNDGYHQGFYNFDLEVSDLDPDLIWVGTIRLNESSDGGATFIPIGAANSQRLSLIHADIQDLEVLGDEVWVASDGGLNYSTDLLQSHESRKTGIVGADYWGFGSGWNEDVLVGGKYHNGNGIYYEAYGLGNYKQAGGVEEATGYVHPIESRKTYYAQGWTGNTQVREAANDLAGSFVSHPALPIVPNESYVESSSSGIYFDPRYADHLYAGIGSGIWKSTNGGSSFELLHDFGQNGRVFEIAIARSNPEVLYCVFQPGGGYWDDCDIHRSADGGLTWQQASAVPTNTWRLEIDVNPEDPDEIWVAANSGNNGSKVFSSLNGGQSWANRTTATLNGERPKDLFFQSGSPGLVYLATNAGVFYWDGAQQDWIDYSLGLPLIVNSLEMRPFFRDGKLRLATYGRGIWEAPLAQAITPLAQPITYRDTLFCSRDTVAFDCYSILNHDGASWEWSFDPEPSYVSSITDRDPKVLFGAEGTYDVTLTVTDGNGLSNSQTIPGMVTVFSQCQPDTIPGDALSLGGNQGDYATFGALNEPTNTFTISAWIKPEGMQNSFAGIAFCRGGSTTAGLNFRDNNELGYHWDNGQWWWSSGAVAEADEWSHVALVVEPERATIYLNGVAYVNEVSHPVEAFDALFALGADINWADRRFRGQMDEVCVWKRALSQEEVRLLRHLTKERLADPQDPAYDPDLLAYFQFNETPGARLLDRIGSHHGDLNGGASRLASSAPVGRGYSARATIAGPGAYPFGETGLSVAFPETGTFPDGEWVISRIDQLPNVLPNTNPGLGVYWILNHYGANSFFSAKPNWVFEPPLGMPSAEAIAQPSIVKLHRRKANEDGNLWSLNCQAGEVNDAFFSFSAGCDLTGSDGQQFYLAGQETDDEIVELSPTSSFEAGRERLRIYPNPIEGGSELLVQYTGTETLKFTLLDAGGKVLSKTTLPAGGTIRLPSALPSGLYFYSVQGATFIQNGKLVVK